MAEGRCPRVITALMARMAAPTSANTAATQACPSGRGSSLSVSEVMTPRVPSLPTMSRVRS